MYNLINIEKTKSIYFVVLPKSLEYLDFIFLFTFLLL